MTIVTGTVDLIEAALAYREAGLSLIPVSHETKRPLFPWEGFQYEIADEATLRAWLKKGAKSIAVVGGAVSGELLVIDFDVPHFYDAWMVEVGELAEGLPVQRTGGGGYQVFLRCPKPGRNDKLAWVPDEKEETGRTIAIETRAEGGYVLVPPSLHPSGSCYELISGDLTAIPRISQARADALLQAARKLDEAPYTRQQLEQQAKRERGARPNEKHRQDLNGQESVIDTFNARFPVERTLERFGYAPAGGRYVRPGGKSPSVAVQDGRSFHHSTNDPLSDGYWHDAFDIFCHWKHGGDAKEAVKEAAEVLGISSKVKVHEQDSEGPLDIIPWPDPPDEAAFHGLAGDMVWAIGPHTEADPVALLVQFLVAFGNMIGRGPHFMAEADYHAMNLFAVLVGTTSKGRKGTSWGQIHRLFKAAALPDQATPQQSGEDMDDLMAFLDATPVFPDDWWPFRRIMSGLSSGEGLIWAVRDPIYKIEAIREKGKPTGETIEILADPGEEDKRLLVLETEFASTLRVLGRDGNTLSALVRQAWDTGSLRTLTKNNPARATDAHISLIGHITKEELLRFLTTTEYGNGFANRLLWFCVRRSKCLPEGGRIKEVNFKPLVERLRKALDFGKTVSRIRRDDEARKIWFEVYPDLSEGKPGLLGAVTSRAEAQVLRMACIYAMLDMSYVVRAGHLKAALALWEYSEASARFIFGDTLGDPVADEILRALRVNPQGMTRTEIRDLFGRNKEAKELERALVALLGGGLVRKSTEQTKGRPIERWFALRASTT